MSPYLKCGPHLTSNMRLSMPRRSAGGDIEKVIAGLQRCSSFLRGRLGKEMEMKSTPRLKFIADRSFDTAEDMAKLLDQPKVKQDLG